MGGMSAPAPCLDGVAAEWDAEQHVREHMRATHQLFSPELRRAEPRCTVQCGERNYEVLKPLVKRLRLPDGTVGQVRVPDVQKQILA